MEKRIREFLAGREEEGLLRSLKEVFPLGTSRILSGGREFINFSSNDYLALASHPGLAEAVRKASSPVTGSTSSRLLSGSTHLHHALERKVSDFKGKEAALVFNSGYQANVGIISALSARDDAVFSDRLNHASIIDGIRLSGAKLFRFRHNDTAHLRELLKKERHKYSSSLIVTETVFSMDGDIAPLEEIVTLKKEYDSMLMVDEAHATGIFGRNSSGIVEEKSLTSEVDIIMGTFSKALGSFGSYAATSRLVRDYLVNTSRSFIYSTALPPAVIAADIAALDLVRKESYRREVLLANASYFRTKLQQNGFSVRGQSQIIPVITGENDRAGSFSRHLMEKGYWVLPLRPPTVPEGEARLRLSITFDHTKEILDEFLEELIRLENTL